MALLVSEWNFRSDSRSTLLLDEGVAKALFRLNIILCEYMREYKQRSQGHAVGMSLDRMEFCFQSSPGRFQMTCRQLRQNILESLVMCTHFARPHILFIVLHKLQLKNCLHQGVRVNGTLARRVGPNLGAGSWAKR